MTAGPSPPLSRRNSSPRPGTRDRARRRHLDRGDRWPGVERHRRGDATAARRASYHQLTMAVVIASDLGKDIAGEPLLRGISFKLERRDRMTLSGRNGAGKTTLLRMLSGEASIDVGELVLAKDTKIALHDQRPPRDLGLTLREYVLTGARELVAIEQELASLEQAMAGGAHDERNARPLRAGAGPARARRRATAGASGRCPRCTVSASATTPHLDRSLADVLRRRADPRLARPRAGRGARPAAARRADQPSRHRVARVARDAPGRLDAAIVLVAHDRWFLEAVGTSVLELEAGRGKFFPGRGTRGAARRRRRELALGRAVERQQAEIERLERFVTRFRAGTRARQAQSRVKKLAQDGPARPRAGRRGGARVLVQAAGAQRPGGVRARGRPRRGRRPRAARRRRAVARARRARVAGRPERRRQDDADRDAGRPARVRHGRGPTRHRPGRRGQAPHRPQRQARASSPSTPRSCRPAARAPCSRRPRT